MFTHTYELIIYDFWTFASTFISACNVSPVAKLDLPKEAL